MGMVMNRQDRTYKDYTSNSIPPSLAILLSVISHHSLQKNGMDLERCRMGLLV